jgi:hypothetical protein
MTYVAHLLEFGLFDNGEGVKAKLVSRYPLIETLIDCGKGKSKSLA